MKHLCLCCRGILVIATPYASGFDHFFIADEVQFKFDRCYRFFKDTVSLCSLCSSSIIFLFFQRWTIPKMLGCTDWRSSYFWHWSFFGICHPPFDWYSQFFIFSWQTAFKGARVWCFRNSLQWWSNGWPGSRYAIQRNGNVLIAFNNKVFTFWNH